MTTRIDYLVDQLREEPSGYELLRGLDPATTKIWNDLCLAAADRITELERGMSECRRIARQMAAESGEIALWGDELLRAVVE